MNFSEFFEQIRKDAQEILLGPLNKASSSQQFPKLVIIKPVCQCNICQRDRRYTPDLDGYLKLGQGMN